MARSTMRPGSRPCSRRRACSRRSRSGRSARSCSSPIPARSAGCSAPTIIANHPTVPAASIVGLVDLDMPLLLYPFTDVTAFGADHSTIGATVAEAGRSMGIAVSPDPMPRGSDLHPLRPLYVRPARRPGGAADDRPCQWRQGALGRLSRQDLSFAAGRPHARRSIGTPARAMPCSIIASPGRWPTRRSGRCGSRATISATCLMPKGPRAPVMTARQP